MKKAIFLLCAIICLFTTSCSNKETNDSNQVLSIPAKDSPNDTSPKKMPVNNSNIDQYLFRDDVVYIDLRPVASIISDGYIAGFKCIPYYQLIASFSNGTLYTMKNVYDDNNNLVSPAGQIGGFVANYVESKRIIKDLFPQDTYIFFVSQGGSESTYIINLLIQLGYDGNYLYNIGGVINREAIESYISFKSNKYFIEGIGDYNLSFSFDFIENLTPISNN